MRGSHNNHRRGSAHYRWSNDRMLSWHGYVRVRVGREHPLADPNGYAYEHLLVWVSAGLAPPDAQHILHHRDEDKTNNQIANLELKSRVAHGVGHQPTALLDCEIVRLRDDYSAGDHTTILAKRYGIPKQTAWKIVRGKTRRNAGGPICDAPLRRRRSTPASNEDDHA